MARQREQAPLARSLASLVACAIIAIAADKPVFNQAENRKIRIEATAITELKAATQEAGAHLGTGYIVVKLRVTPLGPDPLPVGPDDFTLVSRRNGEKGGALPPDGFVNPDVVEALKKNVFPQTEGTDPSEGLLYFMMEGKLKPSQLGLIYAGKAGRLVVDFK